MQSSILIITWVDIIVVALIARNLYIAKKPEIIGEMFKLFGVACATFIAIHYYVGFGFIVSKYLLVPEIIQEIFSFSTLSLFIILMFYVIKEGWQKIKLSATECKSG